MKIERLRISNFRCFGPNPMEIDLHQNVTAFVGNNGSGKTAIFHALARLFGVTPAQRGIRKSDFHVPVESFELASETTLFIECIFSFPELDADEDDPAVPDVFHHMAASGEDEPLKARIRLRATWVDDLTPEGTVQEEVKWITAVGEDFDWDECQKVSPVERGFVQLVYVPASRNAFDQVTSLLKGRLWRAAQWSEHLGETAVDGANRIQTQFDEEDPAQFITERLERRWREVHQGDTDTRPVLRLVESRLEDLLRRAEFVFFPDEAQQVRRLDELSDGQRSLFHIALTAATLEIERDALAADPQESLFDQDRLRRTHLTLLAIEEPENSLSPFFLSRIMLQARSIGEMTGAQVMVSSHSASILSRVEPEEVRYTRLASPSRRASVRALTLPPGETEARRYVRLAIRAYPEIYFARFVILAEGESEGIVIPRLAEAMNFPLDRSFVPVVPLGGRFVAHFWRLLRNLNIPYATLLDLDLGRKHGGAATIASIVGELDDIGNDLSENRMVVDEEIDPAAVGDIDDEELLEEDQAHPWLKALRGEGVYFSSPLDLDFAMLMSFPEAYNKPRQGGYGPRMDAASITAKKATTLKTEGKPEIFCGDYDDHFAWYPYLFLGQSKPETHLAALAELDDEELQDSAPSALQNLIKRVRRTING